MPKIHHVAMWAQDLESQCHFYCANFGAIAGPLYENAAKGFRSRFLTLGDGARLEIMSTTRLPLEQSPAGTQKLGITHLAIALDCEEAVDRLVAQLRAAGRPVLEGPRRTGDGYYEAVVLDPEGNRLELTV
jgi:lactoylglutathione lyase